MKTLILYLSHDGQTRKIAEAIAAQLTGQCVMANLLENMSIDLTPYDRVVIGASIRYGKFNPKLFTFIREHKQQLKAKQGALYTVNLTARKADKNTPQTNVYTRKLLAKIAWQPQLVQVFAGALLYPRYTWFDRTMIRFIMKMTGGETDPRKEIEYTDWQQVRNFADQIEQL
ncbi:protoporphyrinogen oxidase [Gallibacterium salpingitidis]|uniref:Protoporphyrinogen IX dehydrogenase [quinone] n=1 Tax=Gallibacterium salpingitidis TaxID=505341 RepID=A0A1A7Q5H3_9PAST|nr:menaquinone-dependent protoporphyrinogen IX dehydrogenase [Gallibacterium salpingitidis]OBW94155.1 protoporphyrinogen oxidase [Gallibacterium salpingitidis]OBX09152.1 protoporphyrinogen oxidase [Gallibacterium salpingitidis]OBX10965.1 protoporphyrinogen oxidase [Gallibacterium salpingitidis]WKS99656.1 menaquinone-dependent protoporphyrinogen IX dehydrogenase [Gallibacterium salpingitidis]